LHKKDRRIDPKGQPMLDFIQKICTEVGPRIGGSEAEKKAGQIIHNEFSSYCDVVEKEEFSCHPGGFLDFIWITAIIYIAGVLAYFFIHPLLISILVFIALAIYFIQQNLLYEVVDFLFPKKSSFHVIGKILPEKSPKKLVLLSGHHDSAYEFPLLTKLGSRSSTLVIITVAIGFLTILMGMIKTILVVSGTAPVNIDIISLIVNFQNVSTVTDVVDSVQLIICIIGTVNVLLFAFFLRSNNVVMGANDNLSGVATVIEIGKYLSKQGNKPEETEVWLISFAGEEHMRGSKRFVSNHYVELKDRKAMLFNLESLSADGFLLATEENMYLTKHSQFVVEIVKKAAQEVNIPITVGPLRFLGSDAANFSKKGLQATTLFGWLEEGSMAYWHTLEDTPDKLSGSQIAKAAEIALQFVYEVDKS
jgi:hypothetical protein